MPGHVRGGGARRLRPTESEVAGLGLDACDPSARKPGCFHLPSSATGAPWPHPANVQSFAAELGLRMSCEWDLETIDYSTLPHSHTGRKEAAKVLRSQWRTGGALADMIVWRRGAVHAKLSVHVVPVHPVWYSGWWCWRVDEDAAIQRTDWNAACITLYTLLPRPSAEDAAVAGREFRHAFGEDVYFFPVVKRATPGEAVLTAAARQAATTSNLNATLKTPFSAQRTLYGGGGGGFDAGGTAPRTAIRQHPGGGGRTPNPNATAPGLPDDSYLGVQHGVGAPHGLVSPVVFTEGVRVPSARRKEHLQHPHPHESALHGDDTMRTDGTGAVMGPLYLLEPEGTCGGRTRRWCIPVSCVELKAKKAPGGSAGGKKRKGAPGGGGHPNPAARSAGPVGGSKHTVMSTASRATIPMGARSVGGEAHPPPPPQATAVCGLCPSGVGMGECEHAAALRCCVPGSRAGLIAKLIDAELSFLHDHVEVSKMTHFGAATPQPSVFSPVHADDDRDGDGGAVTTIGARRPLTFTIGGHTDALPPAQYTCPVCGDHTTDLPGHMVAAHWHVDTTLRRAAPVHAAARGGRAAQGVADDAEFLGMSGAGWG